MYGAFTPNYCYNESSIKYWAQKLSRGCRVQTIENSLKQAVVQTTFENGAFMTLIAHDGFVSFSHKFLVNEDFFYQKLHELETHADHTNRTVRVIFSVFSAQDELIDTMYFSIHPCTAHIKYSMQTDGWIG